MLTIDKNSPSAASEPLPDALDSTVEELTTALAAIAQRPIDLAAARFALDACRRLKLLKRDSAKRRKQLQSIADGLIPLCHPLPFDPREPDLHPLLEQLMYVELPLMLAHRAPTLIDSADDKTELPSSSERPNLSGEKLICSASARMSESIFQWLDEDGWPHADVLPIFAPLLETWARSMELIQKLKIDFPEDATDQLEWAFRQLLRLLRPDGTLMLSRFDSLPISSADWKSIRKLSSDNQDQSLFNLRNDQSIKLHRGSSSKNRSDKSKKLDPKRNAKPAKLPESSSVSEWGLSGILRSHWASSSPAVCFEYDARSFHIEVGTKRTLLAGECLPDVQLDGNPCMPLDDFEIVCNHHDTDVDYVELQMELSEGVTLHRQLILSRTDDFLIIADTIVPLVSGRIEYACDWSLANDISVLPESETREVYLQDSKIRALVLPVALPEWLVGPSPGKLEHLDSSLRMKAAVDGQGIFVPVFFDLDQKRCKKKRTWRSLTVAEDRQIVRSDVAAAFRVQIGKQQWFFYRAISEKGNRTFFGENFLGEFVLARFDAEDGSVTELLRIE